MRDIEDIIREKAGKENCFRVPDGYFDDFTNRMMAKLPAEDVATMKVEVKTTATKTQRRKSLWQPLVACAACLAAAIFSVVIIMKDGEEDAQALANRHQEETFSTSDEYVDEIADFAMMDNADIYACLDEE